MIWSPSRSWFCDLCGEGLLGWTPYPALTTPASLLSFPSAFWNYHLAIPSAFQSIFQAGKSCCFYSLPFSYINSNFTQIFIIAQVLFWSELKVVYIGFPFQQQTLFYLGWGFQLWWGLFSSLSRAPIAKFCSSFLITKCILLSRQSLALLALVSEGLYLRWGSSELFLIPFIVLSILFVSLFL